MTRKSLEARRVKNRAIGAQDRRNRCKHCLEDLANTERVVTNIAIPGAFCSAECMRTFQVVSAMKSLRGEGEDVR